MDEKSVNFKVLSLFIRMSGDKLKETTKTTEQLIKQGKSRTRAMADALQLYCLAGEVKSEQ